MAVGITGTSANFVGTGVSSSYAPGFYANSSDQVRVYVNNTIQTIGDDYTVSNIGASAGVTITGNFTAGAAVYIERVTPITQLVDTQNNETILEDVLDAEFDKLTMIAQELNGNVDRAMKVPKGEIAPDLPAQAARTGYAAWGAGGALIGVGLPTTVTAASITLYANSLAALAAVTIPAGSAVAYLDLAGRSGFFRWVTGNQSAKVTIDTQKGVYIAPASAPTGASGAWVRVYSGPLNIEWFGAVGDDGTDCYAAIQCAVNLAVGTPIYAPAGRYWLSQKVVCSTYMHMFGAGMGSGPGSTEQYDFNSTTIVCNFANPTAFEVLNSTRGSTFRDMKLDVNPAFRPAAAGNGIKIAAPAGKTVANVRIWNVGFNNFYRCINGNKWAYGDIGWCWFNEWSQDAIYLDTDVGTEGSGGFVHNNYFFGRMLGDSSQSSCIHTQCGYIIITHNEILGAQKGILVNITNHDAGFVRIQQNTIENQHYYGIAIQRSTAQQSTMIAVLDNEFSWVEGSVRNNYLSSVYVDDAGGTNWIQTMQIMRNTTRHYSHAAGLKHYWLGNGQNVQVIDNLLEELSANTPIGISINGAASNTGLSPTWLVSNTIAKGTMTKYSFASNPAVILHDQQGLTFAAMTALQVGNGSVVFCTDGTFANPVAAAGTGCQAKRLNNAWRGD